MNVFSYRKHLRFLTHSQRRRWWEQKKRLSPRVRISGAYVPPNVSGHLNAKHQYRASANRRAWLHGCFHLNSFRAIWRGEPVIRRRAPRRLKNCSQFLHEPVW